MGHGRKLFVGSFTSPVGAVHVLERRTNASGQDTAAYHVTHTYTHSRLVHPAGLLVHGGIIYVLEQSMRALLAFDLATTNFTGTLLRDLPDIPEGLLLSAGC